MYTPEKREIVSADCGTDGKKVLGVNPHSFIILTKKEYNKKCSNVSGIALTSKKNYYSLNYGINLTDDDIEGDFRLRKETFILADRPCRIDKESLQIPYNDGRITEEKCNKIIDTLRTFMKKGKIKI